MVEFKFRWATMAKKLVVCQGAGIWPLSVIKLFPRLRPEKVAPEGQQARRYLYRFQVSGFRCQEGESQNPYMKLRQNGTVYWRLDWPLRWSGLNSKPQNIE